MAFNPLFRSQQRLVKLALEADQLTPGGKAHQFDDTGLSQDASQFIRAINGFFTRNHGYMEAQKDAVAAVAHELRTPLHAMLLELGKLDHGNARALESDVFEMNRTIDRVVCLARLNNMGDIEWATIDLQDVVNRNIERLKPLTERCGCKLIVEADNPETFEGDHASVSEALCALIEYVCEHSPADVSTTITCGPSSRLIAESSVSFLNNTDKEFLASPSEIDPATRDKHRRGLAIMKRTIALHNGDIIVGRSHHGGSRIELRFS